MRQEHSPEWLFPVGTQVVILKHVQSQEGKVAHPSGAVGVVVRSPADRSRQYRVRFIDGFEAPLRHEHLVALADYQRDGLEGDSSNASNLFQRVVLRVVVGSRAFGLSTDESDTDRRGVYVPPAELHWSLFGVPEQLENEHRQEAYWELRKFLVLGLKGNPNVLECLYSPLVEFATPLGEQILAARSAFVSKLIYQTFNGYVLSQFRRILADQRNHGEVKWKHVMHLLRLLLSGISALETGEVTVDVGAWRDRLLAVRQGQFEWPELDAWRRELHTAFDRAYARSTLPEKPNYDRANQLLIEARRQAVEGRLP